jgi:hypothetical protein
LLLTGKHRGVRSGHFCALPLPIEQASKSTLVINLNTAKALGIVVPANLLVLANEVVE